MVTQHPVVLGEELWPSRNAGQKCSPWPNQVAHHPGKQVAVVGNMFQHVEQQDQIEPVVGALVGEAQFGRGLGAQFFQDVGLVVGVVAEHGPVGTEDGQQHRRQNSHRPPPRREPACRERGLPARPAGHGRSGRGSPPRGVWARRSRNTHAGPLCSHCSARGCFCPRYLRLPASNSAKTSQPPNPSHSPGRKPGVR